MSQGKPIGDLVYERLSSTYTIDIEEFVAPRLRDTGLFEFLVAVMLSQNTNDRNAWRAYINLKNALGEITPGKVISISESQLAELIKTAGMHNNRARRMKELASVFIEQDIEKTITSRIRSGELEEARKILLSLPGVGVKTADVAMLMYYGKPYFPVDTHIMRITSRMGLVERVNYDAVSGFWRQNTSPGNLLRLHLLLITHGRRTCTARKPKCPECPIRDLCRYGAER